jgi:hypothetical protein
MQLLPVTVNSFSDVLQTLFEHNPKLCALDSY